MIKTTLLMLAFRCCFHEPFYTPSASMEPTIPASSVVWTDKLPYGNYRLFQIPIYQAPLDSRLSPQRGDVMVFQSEKGTTAGQYLIKRVIGVPGDSLRYADHQLFLNNHPISTAVLADKATYQESIGPHTYTVQYTEEFEEDTWSITLEDNAYFMLGDNRHNSMDSRHWGAIKAHQFIGRVIALQR